MPCEPEVRLQSYNFVSVTLKSHSLVHTREKDSFKLKKSLLASLISQKRRKIQAPLGVVEAEEAMATDPY